MRGERERERGGGGGRKGERGMRERTGEREERKGTQHTNLLHP